MKSTLFFTVNRGVVQIFDKAKKLFVPLNRGNVQSAITNEPAERRDLLVNKPVKEVLSTYRTLINGN